METQQHPEAVPALSMLAWGGVGLLLIIGCQGTKTTQMPPPRSPATTQPSPTESSSSPDARDNFDQGRFETLTGDQQQAAIYPLEFDPDNPLTLRFVQKSRHRQQAGGAIFAFTYRQAITGDEFRAPTTAQEVLKNLAVWPLEAATDQPWKIVTSPDSLEFPSVVIAETPTGLSWTARPYDWDPRPEDLIGLYGDYVPQLSPYQDRALNLYPEHLARQLASIVDAYVTLYKRYPALPSTAYEELGFGLNEEVTDWISENFIAAEFRRAPDQSIWGLAFTRQDGTQIVLIQRKDVERRGGVIAVGAGHPGNAPLADDFFARTQVWERLEDMPVKRLELTALLPASSATVTPTENPIGSVGP